MECLCPSIPFIDGNAVPGSERYPIIQARAEVHTTGKRKAYDTIYFKTGPDFGCVHHETQEAP